MWLLDLDGEGKIPTKFLMDISILSMSCFNLNEKLLLRLIKCISSLEGICILKPILYTERQELLKCTTDKPRSGV